MWVSVSASRSLAAVLVVVVLGASLAMAMVLAGQKEASWARREVVRETEWLWAEEE